MSPVFAYKWNIITYDKRICHVLSELKANGAEQIVFSGGEPFIRKDIVEICKFAKETLFTVNPEEEYFRPYIFDHHSLVQFSKKISNLDQSIPIYDMPAGEIELTCRGNCEVGKEIISIGADGTVYPCHMLHDSSLSLGNILEHCCTTIH